MTKLSKAQEKLLGNIGKNNGERTKPLSASWPTVEVLEREGLLTRGYVAYRGWVLTLTEKGQAEYRERFPAPTEETDHGAV